MRLLTAVPLVPPSFRSRRGEAGPAVSFYASLRRWRRRASLAAIARTISDVNLNPFLFQIETER
jgi:hypothetical protein